MGVMRIDKMLANCGVGSRRDVKELIKFGRVSIDGKKVNKSDIKVDTDKNKIYVDGKEVFYKKYIYLLMNKPSGVISATEDGREKTVIDILPEKYHKFNLFPVGRLDKDTVGLLILTNNGDFAHNTLSPKKHVFKRYFATVSGVIDKNDIKAFFDGIIFDNGEVCKSARLKVCKIKSNCTDVFVEISEGKFHQIKKMFNVIGKKVLFLKRVKFGGLELDEKLMEGEVRELSEYEVNKVFNEN